MLCSALIALSIVWLNSRRVECFDAGSGLSGLAGGDRGPERGATRGSRASASEGGGGLAAPEDLAAPSPGKRRAKRTEDALGTTSVERVESRGCPHCAGREIVGWGRSDGLLRFRCKSCGRTFNALTRTPMAHLRKKEKWLAHAQAMIEGKSLAKTAKLCGVIRPPRSAGGIGSCARPPTRSLAV